MKHEYRLIQEVSGYGTDYKVQARPALWRHRLVCGFGWTTIGKRSTLEQAEVALKLAATATKIKVIAYSPEVER